LDPQCYLSKENERKRYQEHNNDIEDPEYQKFVGPIIRGVKQRFDKKHKGLDFGAGTGPVITKLLRDNGYTMELYDPFFCNNPGKLEETYDFIVCCEVMEHFHFPAKEFALLRSILKPNGALFCMTDIYFENIDFRTWYYKNDPTHVFFYHKNSLEWIQSEFKFSALKIEGRLIQFLV
jgi:SAM-dependent methyltransferase